jgi:Dolichyl-phosphate-mannose-protein mannosyltransferase
MVTNGPARTGIAVEFQDGPDLVGLGAGARAGSSAPTLVHWPTAPVVAAFLASRVVAVAALVIGGSVDEGRLSTAGLTSWDGQWYLMIARHGYGRPPVAQPGTRWPFFPLLPATARAVGLVGASPQWGLIVVANVAFLLALAGVWRLACGFFSRRVAVIAVWAAAVAPFGSVFSMGYPSSLFLAASTWAFVFVHERRYLAAGATGVVATLVRPQRRRRARGAGRRGVLECHEAGD